MRCLVIIGLVLVGVSTLPNMALAKDTDCWEKTGDASIRACTKIIQTKQVFGNRPACTALHIARDLRCSSSNRN